MKTSALLLFLSAPSLLVAAGNESNFLGDWRDKMRDINPRGYICPHAAAAPEIDGKLDDAAWAAAPWTEDFVDIEGDAKPKPKWRTRAKMTWDEANLYIAAEMEAPHVWATLTEHDSVIFADPDFEVFIDPDADSQNYYEFEMNALNTGWDLILPKPYKNGGNADNSWSIPGLKTAVHVRGTLNNPADTDEGWNVEIAIPWKVLAEHSKQQAAPPAEGDQWRLGFSHVEWQVNVEDGKYVKVKGQPEYNWIWSAQGVIDMHRPERWGYVQFTKQPVESVKLKPDATRPARDALQEVAYAQQDFSRKNNRFAASLDELGLTSAASEWVTRPALKLTPSGFESTVALRLPEGGPPVQLWSIDQDNRIQRAPRNARRPEPEPTAATPPPAPTANPAPVPVIAAAARWWPASVDAAMAPSGGNLSELTKALADVPEAQRPGMQFLVENMPSVDLRSLSAAFLLEQVGLAYEARAQAPWGKDIPEDIFLNDILPYSSLNEKRDGSRKKLRELSLPLIKDCKTAGEAAQALNRKLFPLTNVKYSTKRKKPDQSPSESMESGMATCSGLSIMLVDACRSVGVPARVAGTPMWSNLRGNHTWAEIWDGRWHFTGACEPDEKGLDRGWFVGDAAKAVADIPEHAIYASSFKKTGTSFPLIWDETLDWVNAVNVTTRYSAGDKPAPTGKAQLLVRVLAKAGGPRVAAKVTVTDRDDPAFHQEGVSRDETADLNNILPVPLQRGRTYTVTVELDGQKVSRDFHTTDEPEQTVTIPLKEDPVPPKEASAKAVESLKEWLALDRDQRSAIAGAAFAKVPLTKADAAAAQEALWQDHAKTIRETQAEAMSAKVLEIAGKRMPFETVDFPGKDGVPSGGRSLFISMHGGGNAPPEVNTSQWKNQVKLAQGYKPDEGIYVAPRAPTDTWNLWHEAHIDGLFERLIENLIVMENVNPDRVYLMGYSAGGDGVYQLAPRMADHFAAAAMSAGHPNEASPLGLRNLPLAIQVGEKDNAYNRNNIAVEWGKKLDVLRAADPAGYEHFTDLPAGKPHWMGMEDRKAIPWMEKFTRQALPDKVVWYQDDVTHDRFYWLAVPAGKAAKGTEITATRSGQTITLTTTGEVPEVTILLNDAMADLDQPLTIKTGDKVLFTGPAARTIAEIRQTLAERGDPRLTFSAALTVKTGGA